MSSLQASATHGPEGVQPQFNADIRKFIGPFLYGLLTSWALLGLLIHQVYTYSIRFVTKDALFLKILVYATLLLEVIFVAIDTHFVHHLLVEGWGNPETLMKPVWSTRLIALSNSITALIVQSFFLWRLWKINRNLVMMRIVVCFTALVALLHFGCSIFLTRPLRIPHSAEPHAVIVISGVTWAAGFLVDAVITALMITSLLRLRRNTVVFSSTATAINMLLLRAIETGGVAAAIVLFGLILYAHPQTRDTAYFIAPILCLGRFYSTMLLANLNGRTQFSGVHNISISSDGVGPSARVSRLPPSTSIMVTTEVESDHGMSLQAKDVGL